MPIGLSLTGSFQNPAWSPDGSTILFTRFRTAYNVGPADLYLVDLGNHTTRALVSDGSSDNINLPGSCWNAKTGDIVFTSAREPHDEIYVIAGDGQPDDERRLTTRENLVAFEPSFSPDGTRVVFESHQLDVEDHGIITLYDPSRPDPYLTLTGEDEDCRQPNWSPTGSWIVYQKLINNQWDLWLTDPTGENQRKLTDGAGNKTDASFAPDGGRVVYSSDEGGFGLASLFVISVEGGSPREVTRDAGYDGAPSWSPGGQSIVFESTPGDPDSSPGATLWRIDAPR